MAFQTYALFPNLNVYDNISYGLKIKMLSAAEIHDKVMEILQLIGLTGLEGRHTNELSGGQQQRVALARAIVMEPGVLYFLPSQLSGLKFGVYYKAGYTKALKKEAIFTCHKKYFTKKTF